MREAPCGTHKTGLSSGNPRPTSPLRGVGDQPEGALRANEVVPSSPDRSGWWKRLTGLGPPVFVFTILFCLLRCCTTLLTSVIHTFDYLNKGWSDRQLSGRFPFRGLLLSSSASQSAPVEKRDGAPVIFSCLWFPDSVVVRFVSGRHLA